MRKGKFFVSLLTATVLLFSFVVLLSACDDTPVAPTAPALTMLSAQGKDIVDADGEKVVLRGTNLGGCSCRRSGCVPPNKPTPSPP